MKTLRQIGLSCILVAFAVGCGQSPEAELAMPQVSLASLKQASEQQDVSDGLNLPIAPDDSAWELVPCAPAPKFPSVNLTRAVHKPITIWGLAISVDSEKALVTYRDNSSSSDRETGGMYVDLREGTVISTFYLPEYASPFSIDPTGRYAILSRADSIRSEKETLYITKLTDDDATTNRWRPLCSSHSSDQRKYVKEREISWAAFVGSERIVTVNNDRTLHVWRFPELERMASFRGVDAVPCLTPDRTQVIFASGDMLALLDPHEPRIIATRRIGSSPEDAVVAVHPSGKRIAIGGNREAMVIDLEDDSFFRTATTDLQTKPGMRLRPEFSFAGGFLQNDRRLYDVDCPQSVWRFDGTQWELPLGNAYWTVIRNKEHDWMRKNRTTKEVRNELILKSFCIPFKEIRKRIDQTFASSEVLALKSGDPVKIDVSGIPASHQSDIFQTLQTELLKKGFAPSENTEITIKAYVGPEEEREAMYSKSLFPIVFANNIPDDVIRVTYRGQRAHLQMVKKDRVLWSRSGMHKPPHELHEGEWTSDGKMKFFASPLYSIFSSPNLPDYIAGSHADTIGKTTFYVDGVLSRTKRPRKTPQK